MARASSNRCSRAASRRASSAHFDPHHLTRVAIAPVVMAALWKHSFGRLEVRNITEDAYLDTHLRTASAGIAIDPATVRAVDADGDLRREDTHETVGSHFAGSSGACPDAPASRALRLQQGRGASEQAPPVRVTRAVVADQRLHATYSGEVRARYEIDLGFRVGGKILDAARWKSAARSSPAKRSPG